MDGLVLVAKGAWDVKETALTCSGDRLDGEVERRHGVCCVDGYREG